MLLISTSSTATGDSVTVHNRKTRDLIAVQSTSATTATILIQGRIGDDHDWITLDTLTDSDFGTVPWFPFMRADVTAVSGALVVSLAGG